MLHAAAASVQSSAVDVSQLHSAVDKGHPGARELCSTLILL